VTGIPEDVQGLIASEHPEVSVNDRVVGTLARRYGIPWEPVGMPSRRAEVGESILVKLPEPIWAAVKGEAVPYLTMSDVVIRALQEETH
jgi:hypothetical protein